MVDDTELLRRYAEENSEAAFRELVHRHLNMVYSAAIRRVGGDAHAAADVAQQVFAGLAQQAPYLSANVVLSGWLYGATRNVAADHVRKERRRKRREEEANAMQQLSSEPEDKQDWERLKPVLDRAMDELGARDREALVLRFFAQRPFADIGRALGISADAARMRVDRALERLHRSLVRHGAAPTIGAMTVLLSEKAMNAAPAGLHATLPASALASAATATSSLLGTLHLMATAKASLAITVSALLVVGLVGYREFRAAQTTDSQLAAENRRVAALQISLGETRRGIAGVEADIARLPQSTTRIPGGETPASAASPPSPAPTPQEMKAAGDAFMAKYPEVRARLVALRHAGVAGKFYRLFQELALTPAQIEEFETLVSGPSNLWMVHYIGLPPMHLVLNGPSPDDDVRVQLEHLLGPKGYQRYVEYAATNTAQIVTQQLARNLYVTPTALTASQATALVTAIMDSPAPVDKGRFDWKSVVEKARSFLSEPQLEWLRGIEAENAYDAAMKLAVIASRQQPQKDTSP